MKFWIDIKNSHEPLFFQSIKNSLPDFEYYFTCRDFAEITDLLENYKINFKVIGHRPEGSLLNRRLGFLDRTLKLLINVPNFDISLNHWSIWSIIISWLKSKPSIVFNDNDINPINFSSIFTGMITYLLTPKYISKEYYIKQGLDSSKIFQYDGFKENIYIADYTPDADFKSQIPFDDYVTIRAENTQALYYGNDKKTIVPDLISQFNKEGLGVVFLPRYKSDKELVNDQTGVYVPEKGLNGLDLCYHSRAVLTGAGTFSREAAIIGSCAVSFFGGENLLSVDKEMIKRKWVYHSRVPEDILNHVRKYKKKKFDVSKSKLVKSQIHNMILKILEMESKNK